MLLGVSAQVQRLNRERVGTLENAPIMCRVSLDDTQQVFLVSIRESHKMRSSLKWQQYATQKCSPQASCIHTLVPPYSQKTILMTIDTWDATGTTVHKQTSVHVLVKIAP